MRVFCRRHVAINHARFLTLITPVLVCSCCKKKFYFWYSAGYQKLLKSLRLKIFSLHCDLYSSVTLYCASNEQSYESKTLNTLLDFAFRVKNFQPKWKYSIYTSWWRWWGKALVLAHIEVYFWIKCRL